MKTNDLAAMHTRSRNQLIMLTAQFLLGMAVVFIGMPDEASGVAKGATIAFMVLHILIALGLFVNAILMILRARPLNSWFKQRAWAGLGVVVLTIATGVIAMSTGNDWWSYAMGVGFIAALWVYVVLCVRSRFGVLTAAK